jgi:hypothetical protein
MTCSRISPTWSEVNPIGSARIFSTLVIVVGARTFGKSLQPSFAAKIFGVDKSIKMQDLTRHVMVGVGSFGQVWLATNSKTHEEKQVFALTVQSKNQLIEGVVAEINMRERSKRIPAAPRKVRKLHRG